MSVPYSGQYDIEIGGQGEIIDIKSLRRTFKPEGTPRLATTGERTYDDLDQDWSFANWDDLRGGDTQVKHKIDTKYYSSSGIDPRGDAKGNLGITLLKAVERKGTIAQIGGSEQDRILKAFNQYLFAFGIDSSEASYYDGTHWLSLRARARKGFAGATIIGKYCYAVSKDGVLFRFSVRKRTNTVLTELVASLDLSDYGTVEHEVTAMSSFQGYIVLGVGHEILQCDVDDYALTSIGKVADGHIKCFTEEMGAYETSVDTSVLYFGVSKVAEEGATRTKIYSGATIYSTGLTRIHEVYTVDEPFHIESLAVGVGGLYYGGGYKDGLEIKGRIYKEPGHVLVKELEDETNSYNSAILYMKGGREVLAGFSHHTGIYCIMESGGGFPAWAVSLTADADNIVSGIENYNGQIYFSVRNSGIYRVMTDEYVTTANIIFSHFTAQLDLVKKLFSSLRIELKATLSATQEIDVSVRENDEATWGSLGTMTDTDGLSKTFEFAAGWLQYGASIKLTLTQLASETPPQIKAVVLQYTQKLAGESLITVRIRAQDVRNTLRDGSWETRTAKEIVERQLTLKAGGNRVVYNDPDENAKNVMVRNVTDGIMAYSKAKLPVRFCQVELAEVKSE